MRETNRALSGQSILAQFQRSQLRLATALARLYYNVDAFVAQLVLLEVSDHNLFKRVA